VVNELFGIPMSALATGLVASFVMCLAITAVIGLRRPVLARIGLRNLPRRPVQTVLVVIGLMLSTLIFAAALTTGTTLNRSITSEVFRLSGEVDELIVPSGGQSQFAAPAPGVTFPEAVAATVREATADDPAVEAVIPALWQPVPVFNQRSGLSEPVVNLVGLDPASLAPIGGLRDLDGRVIDLAALGAGGVVLGRDAAEQLDARAGDRLTLYFERMQAEVTVVAVAPDGLLTGRLSPGGASGMAMPLDRAQMLLERPGQVSFIAVSNRGDARAGLDYSDEVTARLNQVLEGSPYRAIPVKQRSIEQAEQAGETFASFFLVFGLFSIAAGLLLIFLIFALLAAERKPEMGMLRALGMKRRHLIGVFVLEGLGYNLAAALVGAILGVLVAFGIAAVMGWLIGDFIVIEPAWRPRDLVVAYTLGVTVTYVTVAVAAWRVSRLNIVAAVRDLPEPSLRRAGRRWLVSGIIGLVAGGLLLWAGRASEVLFPFGLGMSILPLSLAVLLRRFSVPARPLYSGAALLVLAYWLLPDSLHHRLFGRMESDVEMFILAGIAMVAAATVLIVWNADLLTALVGLFGRSFRSWLPAVKIAVSYPLAHRGRTGLTIAMFSLILFSLVVMSTINANFVALFASDRASAGWEVTASQPPTNPIEDFREALAEAGIDDSGIAAVGRALEMGPFRAQVRQQGAVDWSNYPVSGIDSGFALGNDAPLQLRVSMYGSDRDAWEAIVADPTLAILDANTLQSGVFGGGPVQFRVEGVQRQGSTMEPLAIELSNPIDGRTIQLTVIGVIDAQASGLFGVFVGQDAFRALFPEPARITYYLDVTLGTDVRSLSRRIEAGLIPYGVQSTVIADEIAEQTSIARGFIRLIQGFMALGLVVGIAALGVVSFRAVVERRHEIGTLRAIGYRQSMVAAGFLLESTLVTGLGVVSGLVLGLSLSRLILVSEQFSEAFQFGSMIVPWGQIAFFAGLALTVALLMAYVPARQASRVSIVEALRYE
jgi:putative ABC transport system permease protein